MPRRIANRLVHRRMNESDSLSKEKSLVLSIKDPEGNIMKLLELIARNTNAGHSFSVDIEGEEFYIDGDGWDKLVIEDIKEV